MQNISSVDLASLMYNVYRSIHEFEYNDAEMALTELIEKNNHVLPIKEEILEKFLYCANLLAEKELFWHPENKSFDDFLKEQKWPEFDRKRNYFKSKKDI